MKVKIWQWGYGGGWTQDSWYDGYSCEVYSDDGYELFKRHKDVKPQGGPAPTREEVIQDFLAFADHVAIEAAGTRMGRDFNK